MSRATATFSHEKAHASDDRRMATLAIAGGTCLADPSGALFFPEAGMMVVSDLHLEKGSSLAARGALLPPYDSTATLLRLAAAIARLAPRCVVALGDSFHDCDGPARLGDDDRASLAALQSGRDWIWIAGNHDPDLPASLGGRVLQCMRLGQLWLRHEPTGAVHEIAGHLHPVASVCVRGRTMRRRCFASDGERLVMPAFGAYAGGLNVHDAAFEAVFGSGRFHVHLLGQDRIHTMAAARCRPD